MKRNDLFEKTARLKAAQKKAAESLDDETALEAAALYPEWSPGTEYNAGDRVRYADKLYKTRQKHTAQDSWKPSLTASIYEVIAPPTEAGTQENPIAYSAGMALEKDKYYTDGGQLYVCFRDSGVPLYNALSELVGLYVNLVEGARVDPREGGQTSAF